MQRVLHQSKTEGNEMDISGKVWGLDFTSSLTRRVCDFLAALNRSSDPYLRHYIHPSGSANSVGTDLFSKPSPCLEVSVIVIVRAKVFSLRNVIT